MISCLFSRVGLWLLLSVFAIDLAAAQSEPPAGTFGAVSNTVANAGSYYYFTESGAPTVRIQLWGEIESPGLYDLEAGTDLRTLLSIAGGITLLETPNSKSNVKIVVIREGETSRQTISTVDALDVLRVEPVLLYDGDSVYVESIAKRKFTLRDGITIVASLLGIILAYERVVN